jgi:uncharacterized protein (DUF2147 family)
VKRFYRFFWTGLFLLLPLAAAAGDPVYDTDAVVGLWATEPNDDGAYSHMEIYKQGAKYHGRIAWLSDPVYGDDEPEGEAGQPRLDHENPDPALRSRPLLGMELMRDFTFNGKNKWEDGRIYDPESGKEYRCKVTMKDPGTLEIFGYIKVGFAKFGRDTIWKRVVEEATGE